MTKPNHLLSNDGSSTLYSSTFDQYYHNPNGAISESKYQFFELPKLAQLLPQKAIHILEVGFGTGLNFLLSLDYYLSADHPQGLHFYSTEIAPIDIETASHLNYANELNRPELEGVLPRIFAELKPGMNHFQPISELDVHLHLFVGEFAQFEEEGLKADFIFHDAFSPEANPELWTPDVFEKLKKHADPSVVLTTYSSASKARAAMAVTGWKIARVRGALGKREMTIAALDGHQLGDYKRVNEERLAERYQNGAFD